MTLGGFCAIGEDVQKEMKKTCEFFRSYSARDAEQEALARESAIREIHNIV